LNAQDLKNSILQLAVQGKLVEQRAEEGTARELLEQIKLEKEQLIKDKKIKKSKPLPEITKDEIPFEIPEPWEWVRLSQAGFTQTGNTPPKIHPEYFGSTIPFVGPGDIANGKISFSKGLSEAGRDVARVAYADSVLQVCIGGSIGKCAICNQEVAFNQQINAIYPVISLSKYLYYVLDSSYFKKFMRNNAGGTATPIINRSVWDSIVIPLPPLKEQYRIIAKIEEILPYIDQYDKAYAKMETFNKKFPEDMKKSILQMAIQGKLVEQRPKEGTADELYEQIIAEKAQLIKDGKIKKDKRVLDRIVKEEDIPFEIPENWKWVYLGTILNKLTDGTHKTPKYVMTGVKFVSVKDMSSGSLCLDNTKFITEEEHEELYARCNPERGDILLSKVGTTGVPAIVDTDEMFSLFVSVALLKINSKCLYNKYLYYVIYSPLVQKQASANTRGVGNKNWVLDAIADTVVPLPPLAEQKRIVAKIEELLQYCDILRKKNIYVRF
jgi:type I restriction enzyme S subunit